MEKNTGEDKKTLFFYLILVDFIIALQIAAVSFFPKNSIDFIGNLANGSFILSFALSFLVFLIFSGVLKNIEGNNKVIQPGLIFMILGSLANFFWDNPSAFIFGRTVCGMGAGMVLADQIGIIRRENLERVKNFSLAAIIAIFFGLTFGPAFLEFLSGPKLDPLGAFFILTSAVALLPLINLPKILERFFSGKWIGMVSGWGIWYSSSFYYDRILYPALMLWFGNFWGGIAAASGAMIFCLGFLLYYEKTDSKWISSTEEVLNNIARKIHRIEKYNFILRLFFSLPRLFLEISLRLVSQRGILGFVALSCLSDPFVTLSYYRKDRADGLSRRDWILFLVSGVVANAYWILYTSVILVFVRAIWKYFPAIF